MNLIHAGNAAWKKDLQNRALLDQLSALPPYVFRKGEQILMPSSNILASIHLKDYKKGKSPFGVKVSKYFTQKNTARRKPSPAQIAEDEALEDALHEKEIGPSDLRERNSSYEEDRFEPDQSPVGVYPNGETTFSK